MTLEKAIDLLESYDFEEGHPDLTQAAYMGAAALREELAGSKPLTPEQLREMAENVPVWIGGKGLNGWDIFVGISTAGPACFLRAALPMEGCGKTWAPYRRKPEPHPVEGGKTCEGNQRPD
ncbi:hypothetical protein [uncultured Oscillibacter sp.]|uniref:hypothetical protein n=1 Tax=uncultured Oscillibacter sp. TaxID=876091 RepID=UPI0026067C7D|nr:hypothetical protein [uncultured Oscillibacter sp.]